MADYRIWPATNGPNTDAAEDGVAVNLGLIFRVSQTCWAKAIHFYRGNTNVVGPAKGRIFLVSSETVVSGTTVDFTLSGTGWQTANLATPVQLSANTSYKVAIHTDDNYTATGGYWSTGAGVGGITNGPLTAPDAGGSPLGLGSIQQGSFRYTSDPDLYPNSYFNGGNYWVDVTVTDTDPGAGHVGTGTAPLVLAATGTGTKQATGTGTAALSMSASQTGAKAAAGIGSAGLTLTATSTGAKQTTGTGTAPLSFSAIVVGAKTGVGTAAADLGLGGSGVGAHQGTGPGGALLALVATGAGVHRGVGTGTAALTLTAGPAQPSRDLQLSIGHAGSLWTIGPAGSPWTIGKAGAT